MKISDYVNLIKEIPVKEHAFEIKIDKWNKTLLNPIVKKIKKENKDDSIILSRWDLLNSKESLEKRIIKILMWGYPSNGRGKNLQNLLENENFKNLKSFLAEYKQLGEIKEITLPEEKIKGLGISTLSKFLYFLGIKIQGSRCQILDDQIIERLRRGQFEELLVLSEISRPSAIRRYSEYIELLEQLSRKYEVSPDQIELFLFKFGNLLKPVK